MTKIVIIIVNFIYLFIFACVTGTTSLLLTGVAAYTKISPAGVNSFAHKGVS